LNLCKSMTCMVLLRTVLSILRAEVKQFDNLWGGPG
jgi:hypothetical protein